MPVAGFPIAPPSLDNGRGLERFMREVVPYLPEGIRAAVESYVSRRGSTVPEEVRLRVLRPVRLVNGAGDTCLDPAGRPVDRGGIVAGPADILRAVELVSGSSLYALEEQIRLGFVTIPGGHRVGLAGTAVSEGPSVRGMRDISGLNYRVAKEAKGLGDAVVPFVTGQGGVPLNTVVISPPGCGKTTLLRDLVRCLSDGEAGARPSRVCLVDERSEVAACVSGVPRNYVGQRTDVLDACPKAAGMMAAVRALSPEVVATDEIGRPEDVTAIFEAVASGVAVLATVHARDLVDAARRPAMADLLGAGAFDRVVVLSRRYGPGTIESVQDIEGGVPAACHGRGWKGVASGVREAPGIPDAHPGVYRGGPGGGVGVLLSRQ